MSIKQQCRLLSFDYLDYDVFLNVRVFYRLAGFVISANDDLTRFQLVVVLRGLPPRIFAEYCGPVHYYDYVREHSYDLRSYFPNASQIYHISIESIAGDNFSYKYIHAYLPVIPPLWQFSVPFFGRDTRPVHISNYKPLQNDIFQQQLIYLIRNGKIKVYGAKWDRIKISAKPLSYLSANIKLSSFMVCYGLMYPYQRGKSLSGRMWQAPLQGCIVISEENTNPFHCPGVIEVASFSNAPKIMKIDSTQIARQASQFWWDQSIKLARDLDLNINWKKLRSEIYYARLLMLKQHFEFFWKFYIVSMVEDAVNSLRKTCVRLLRKLRI